MSDGALFELNEGPSPIEAAVERQLAWLEGRNLLDDSNAIVVALVKELADVIGKSAGRGRGSSVALASKELREALAMLPQPAGDEDPWEKMQRELQEESDRIAEAARARSGR